VVWSSVHDLGPLDGLTARELEVLALLGKGQRTKEIAETLHRSVSTIDGHRERIGQKLGLNDRAELVSVARRAGLRLEDAEGMRVDLRAGLN
jgi:DNA-binding NarL/FixJ family response regulator